MFTKNQGMTLANISIRRVLLVIRHAEIHFGIAGRVGLPLAVGSNQDPRPEHLERVAPSHSVFCRDQCIEPFGILIGDRANRIGKDLVLPILNGHQEKQLL